MDSLAGLSGNPRSATACRLTLNLYNGPTNHLVLVVSGGPQTRVPGPGRPHNCPLTIPDLPMDASWTNDARGSRLRVHLDDALQHPQQDVDNALVHVEWRLQAAPVRVLVQGRSRSRGIVESFACPRSRRLQATARFTTASGPTATARAFALCR